MATGVELGVPMPCFSTALAFYDGYRSEMLPANLLQAQRVSNATISGSTGCVNLSTWIHATFQTNK